MSHAMLTMIAPLKPARVADAQAEIAALGNPAVDPIRDALAADPKTGDGIHFASMHAIRSRHSDEAWILLEFSSDGTEQWAVDHLASAIGDQLRRVLLLIVLAVVWAAAWTIYNGSFGAFVKGLLSGGVMALVLALALLGIAYWKLRSAEASDGVDPRAPEASVVAGIFARENRCQQNHMISITERKPGFLRAFTQRLAFWAVGGVAGRLYPPGFLGTIGTIHFARWVTI